MSHFTVTLRYTTRDAPRIKRFATIEVDDAPTAHEATQRAIEALRKQVPGANIYGSQAELRRAAQQGGPAWSSRN